MNMLSSVCRPSAAPAKATIPETTTTYWFNGTTDNNVVWGTKVSWTGQTKYITPIGVTTKCLLAQGWGWPETGAGLSTLSPITLLSRGYSFSFFFYSSDVGSSRWIITLYDAANFNNNLILYMHSGKLALRVNGTDYFNLYDTLINDNVWRHITYVVKPSTGSATVDIYVNKTIVLSNFAIALPNSSFTNTSICQSLTTNQSAFTGYLYKFQYFDHALDATDVSALY